MVIVPVILKPRDDRREEARALLKAFRDSLIVDPPKGMQALVVLQAQTGELIVEGHWRDADDHRAYRSTARGAELLTRLAECCDTVPVTYYAIPDPGLSFHPGGTQIS